MTKDDLTHLTQKIAHLEDELQALSEALRISHGEIPLEERIGRCQRLFAAVIRLSYGLMPPEESGPADLPDAATTKIIDLVVRLKRQQQKRQRGSSSVSYILARRNAGCS